MSTSLRPDIKHLYIEPQAQSIVTKIYTQHRGLIKYAYQNAHNGAGEKPSYKQGEWNPAAHPAYVPYGFKSDSGMAQFTSKIYCLDSNSNRHSSVPMECLDVSDPANPTINPGANCCAAPGVIIYLVTYGRVPQKWKDLRTGKPNSAILNAMQDTLGYINGFGYVINKNEYKGQVVTPGGEGVDPTYQNVYDVLNTSMGILGQGTRPYTPLPQYLINDLEFKNTCENNYCLIYMSSI